MGVGKDGELMLKGYTLSVAGYKNVLEIDSGDV
jgi:hypothetical protein